MLARQYRFHGLNALSHVYKQGRTVRGPSLAVKYTPNKQLTFRCAVVVSKKVSKSAVVRNRIRRRIYEVIREHQKEITEPVDLVITVYDEKLVDLPRPQLGQTLYNLFAQAHIVR